MTHMLHRQGSVETLKGDYTLIAYTSRVNRDWARAKLSKIAEIVLSSEPTNLGSGYLKTNMAIGFDPDEYIKGISRANSVNCCFASKEKLRDTLQKLKEADVGVSITVSGLIDEVIPMAQGLGIKPHTINLSMGIVGKTDKLPEQDVLEMTTMCGHALIAGNLVKKVKQEVTAGKLTPRQASLVLGRPCVCGVFNLERCEKSLRQQ